MKNLLFNGLFIAIAGCLALNVSAQTSSTYFLENYVYNYRLNPAIMAEKSFLGFGVGNIAADLDSDLGVSTLLYPDKDGEGLVTGFNGSVSSEEFLSKINDINNLGLNVNYNLFSVGKRRENRMTNFEINLRALGSANISGDLFEFLKTGTDNGSCDLSTTALNANSFAEIAYGKAFQNKKQNFVFGFRVKALVGLAGAEINLNNTQIQLSEDKMFVDVNAQAKIACAPITGISTSEDGKINIQSDLTKISPCGYGGAVDLGLVWKPFDRLSLSASISDLGLMQWNYNQLAESKGYVEFNGVDATKPDTDFEEEIKSVGDQFTKLINLQSVNGTSSRLSMIPFTARAGAKFRLPIFNFIKIGAHASYHNAICPVWDARLGASVTPFNFLSLSANIGKSNYGTVCGGAVSLSLLFFNLYVALDSYSGAIGLYTPDEQLPMNIKGIPYPVDKFNYKLNVGLTMQLGKRYK